MHLIVSPVHHIARLQHAKLSYTAASEETPQQRRIYILYASAAAYATGTTAWHFSLPVQFQPAGRLL